MRHAGNLSAVHVSAFSATSISTKREERTRERLGRIYAIEHRIRELEHEERVFALGFTLVPKRLRLGLRGLALSALGTNGRVLSLFDRLFFFEDF